MACKRLAFALAIFVIGAGGDIIVFPTDGPGLIEDEFVDEPAVFGDGLPLEGLKGFVVVGVPRDGCTTLAPPPAVDNFTGKWIVLLARYNCSFEQKIRNAQSANYDAAIVHNVNSTDLERMSAKNAVGIRIPSVFVSNETGYNLEINYTYKNDYYIIMNREVPFDINTHLLLPFAVVVGLCFITMIIFMIVKCIKDRRRAQRHRLPNDVLKKIPTCKFSKGDPYDTCAICLDDYLEGDKLRVLPCAHAYHCKCIDPWLTKNRRVCPVCKRRVLAAGERGRRSDSESESDDSSAPLVTSARTNRTQGGTFDQQRENPFAAAQQFVARLQRQCNMGRGRNGRGEPAEAQDAETPNGSDPSRQENDADRNQSGSSSGSRWTGAAPAGSGSVVPFLSGVLNLRNDHFGRRGDEESEPLLTVQSSLPVQRYETSHERERRPRGRRASSATSATGGRRASSATSATGGQANVAINAARGEIGVAALPNTHTGRNRFVP